MQLPKSASSRPCGVVFVHADGEHSGEAYLPLEQTEVLARIIDVSAIVTVTQKFLQYSPIALGRAKYVFPVPARAAVCGFEMVAEDGTVIAAVAKEREEARREHEAAIRQGFMTGLVEHVTDDIFSISLGAVPGPQILTTKLTYVLDLMDDEVSDQVRLQLPMYIGARYGTTPVGMAGARTVPPYRISISVDVRMQGAVQSIASPTHPTIALGAPSLFGTRGLYQSAEFLAQDFVLAVKADGLDAPRCFAQRAPDGTVAMQLSVVPKFSLPPVPVQEYIFVVDRSGSMQGSRIEMAKKALVMLLRALPSQGTQFNIISFGSRCDSYRTSSMVYNEQTLALATQHVDSMDANLGGTEIQSAMQHVFSARRRDLPTSVFVLTDGESYNINPTLDLVAHYVKESPANAPLRVFTLGIGESTSTAMCEGIARSGNGLCLMAATSEAIIGKCSKLVRASRTYILKNVTVDWGVRTDLAEMHRTGSTTLKGVRQAPATIDALYPGNRFVVFALVEDAAFAPPKEVVIRAQRDGHGEVLQFSVPVQEVAFPPADVPAPLLQTLAARRAIMDVEDGAHTAVGADARALIVRLGTRYQLASRFTSFVAVDRRTNAEVRREPEPGAEEYLGGYESRERERERARAPDLRGGFAGAAPAARGAYVPPPAQLFGFGSKRARGAPMGAQPQQQMQMSALNVAPPGGSALFGAAPSSQPPAFLNLRATGINMAPQLASWGLFGQQAQAPPGASASFGAAESAFSSMAPVVPFAPPAPAAPAFGAAPAALSTEDKVLALVRLQSFDGSFPATPQLEALVGAKALGQAPFLGVPDVAWATVLAVAYLKAHMRDQPELLDGLVEKARDFVARFQGVDVDALVARAESLVS